MRTRNLFRMMAAASLAVISISSFGQAVTTSGTADTERLTTTNAPTSAAPEAVDFATINSIMPYSITPDANVAAMVVSDPAVFLPSVYNWRISGGGSLVASDGTSALTVPGANNPTGYPQDYDVAVQWGAVAGQYTLTVNEQTRNAAGLPTCAGSDSTLTVFLMPEPIIAFVEAGSVSSTDNDYSTAGDNTSIVGTANDGIIGGCSVNGKNILFNVVYSGTENFNGYYSYVYTPLGGVAAAPVTGTIAQQDAGGLRYWSALPATPNEATNNGAFSYTIPASGVGAYGKYVFTLTGVTDLVYRKSFSADATKVGGAAESDEGIVNAGLSTANTSASLTVYSLPTPTTGTIKHVNNNTTVW